MSKRLVLLGGGGHGKVCYEIASTMNYWEEIIILDDNLDNDFFTVHGEIKDWKKYTEDADFFVAIGDNRVRREIYEALYRASVSIATLIHPSAIISASSVVSSGTVLMPYSIINASSIIGRGAIINTGAIVEHDCKIANYVHISPNAVLSGGVTVGELAWVGAGALVKQSVHICAETTIGLGAVVVKSIKEGGIYIGVPAMKKDAKGNM